MEPNGGLAARPLVSIITPTLNQGRFIEQTIRSIKAQTYATFEHIVIDGGSTDETHDILRRHEGSYPMRWVSEPDGGMYDAINKGLALARGDVLAYLNSDDLYLPWTLEAVVEAFGRNPDAGLVYGDALRLNEVDGSISPWFQPPFRRADMIAVGSLVQPTVFWRRRVQDHIGSFDTMLRYVGDLDYWLRAGESDQLLRLDEVLAVDRVHEAALSVVAHPAMQAEDAATRRRYGPDSRAATAMAHAHVWLSRRRLWLSFVLATRSRDKDDPWRHVLRATGAEIPPAAAVLGLLPLVGSHHRRAIRWRIDPVALATGAGDSSRQHDP